MIRHRLGPDEIAPAQFLRRDPEPARGVVDQPLDRIGRLRPPGAAIGVDRHGVGEHALDPDMDRRDRVDAAVHDRARDGRDLRREIRQIGAHIGDDLDIERQKAQLLVERQFEPGDVVAALRVGHEGVGALGGPFDRRGRASSPPTAPGRARDREKASCRSRRRRRGSRRGCGFPGS